MMITQLMDAPATATLPTSDTPARGEHLLEHPRGRGFSVVSRLAREVQPTTAPPRHRRDDAGPELVERTA
jgi:hypothetical protein